MGSSVIFSVIRRTDELDEGSYGISKMLRYVALMLLSPMFFIAQSTRRFQDWGSRWSTKSMNRQGCPVK